MIEFANVSKFFKTDGSRKTILDRVSVTFESGYSYGLLGVNGAGKSTTMRMIANSILPNSGSIRKTKRISWPLGFAGGFHPKMTGRENVKFVARVYGEDINRVVRFVEEFSEIGDYINQPIETYSSGMASRLAFGVSMAVEFDCYLVDEIMSVGDERFQRRCAAEFDARRAVSDLIVVSHSMSIIEAYCQRGAVLVDGKLMMFDDVGSAVAMYNRLNR